MPIQTELLDTFAEEPSSDVQTIAPEAREYVGICASSFTWNNSDGTASRPDKRAFRLRVDEEVVFKSGRINLVVGPTGCGKTSLLMALLGSYTAACRVMFETRLTCPVRGDAPRSHERGRVC